MPPNVFMMLIPAGPSTTMNRHGRMKITIGNRILTGSFIACSSACWRRLRRSSEAWICRVWATGTPSFSAWARALTIWRSSGTRTRSDSAASAAPRGTPARVSCTTRASSEASGPSVVRATRAMAASRPRPARTEITIWSTVSASDRRITCWRSWALCLRTRSGPKKPNRVNPAATTTIVRLGEPVSWRTPSTAPAPPSRILTASTRSVVQPRGVPASSRRCSRAPTRPWGVYFRAQRPRRSSSGWRARGPMPCCRVAARRSWPAGSTRPRSRVALAWRAPDSAHHRVSNAPTTATAPSMTEISIMFPCQNSTRINRFIQSQPASSMPAPTPTITRPTPENSGSR